MVYFINYLFLILCIVKLWYGGILSEFKVKVLESFWRKADCWGKLLLLRLMDAINTSMGGVYLDEMMGLQNVDGGFKRRMEVGGRIQIYLKTRYPSGRVVLWVFQY